MARTTKQQSHDKQATAHDVENLSGQLLAARNEIHQHIFGQQDTVEQLLIALLAGGHALLIGVPGLAKTKLVDTTGAVFGLKTNRIQCTPDLMPSDIVGAEVLHTDNTGERSFRLVQGPLFTQLLMADEINRASPRTQSALLQAMQEKMVTIGGQTYPLPEPFHVLATQNPVEQEGTYPLPEAQLDRFLLTITVPYPDADTEKRIILETTTGATHAPKTMLDTSSLQALQGLVRDMPVGEVIVEAILSLIRATRPEESTIPDVKKYIQWGAGPRAGQALMLGVRARALLDGRFAPSLDDVAALAKPILRHRVHASFAARADGRSLDDLLDAISEPVLTDARVH